MGAVFAIRIGLTTFQVALFIVMLFAGALVLQYPIGWLSDRIDRRKLIFGAAFLGAESCAMGWIIEEEFWPLITAAFFNGGVTSPLYALFWPIPMTLYRLRICLPRQGGLSLPFGLGAILINLVKGTELATTNVVS